MNTDNRKNILVLGKESTNGLDDTIITAEAKYSVDITKSWKKICFSLQYNEASSFMHANGVKIQKFAAKVSELKQYLLCLQNILKDFSINVMRKTLA